MPYPRLHQYHLMVKNSTFPISPSLSIAFYWYFILNFCIISLRFFRTFQGSHSEKQNSFRVAWTQITEVRKPLIFYLLLKTLNWKFISHIFNIFTNLRLKDEIKILDWQANAETRKTVVIHNMDLHLFYPVRCFR